MKLKGDTFMRKTCIHTNSKGVLLIKVCIQIENTISYLSFLSPWSVHQSPQTLLIWIRPLQAFLHKSKRVLRLLPTINWMSGISMLVYLTQTVWKSILAQTFTSRHVLDECSQPRDYHERCVSCVLNSWIVFLRLVGLGLVETNTVESCLGSRISHLRHSRYRRR